MISYGAVLRLNLFFGKWSYTNMFTSSYIQVSHTFTIIVPIADSTLKFIKDTKSNIFGNPIFDRKVVTLSGLIIKLFTIITIKNYFNDFFNLVLVCKDIE